MNSPIAVTGATGFVGRRLVALLAESHMAVRALVRRPAGLDPALRAALEPVEGDILDAEALKELTDGAGAVIHCAGALADATAFTPVNVAGTRALAHAAHQAGVARFVHVSSLSAREPQLSAYGASKRAGEDAVIEALPREAWVVVRPPVVYGPGDKATLPLLDQLTRPTAWLPGSRLQRFSLLYVDDLARALIRLAESPTPTGSVHELHDGTRDGYAWTDLVAAAASVQGLPSRVRYLPRWAANGAAHVSAGLTRVAGKIPAVGLTPDKVRELYHRDWVCRRDLLDEAMDWHADVAFPEGFATTVAWYRQHGWLPPDAQVANRLSSGQGVSQ